MTIKYENALVSTEQTDWIEKHLLGLHLYHTRRYLPVPGHGSIPNRRLLTRNWQLRLSWHSSSIFCSQECTQETEKQKLISVPSKGNVKRRQTGERRGHPCLHNQPWHKTGDGAQHSGYHRSHGLSAPCTGLRSRFSSPCMGAKGTTCTGMVTEILKHLHAI